MLRQLIVRRSRMSLRLPIGSATMLSCSKFVVTVFAYLLVTSSTKVAMSFSSTVIDFRNRYGDLAKECSSFGTYQRLPYDHASSSKYSGTYLRSGNCFWNRIGRTEDIVVQKMVVDGTSIDLVDGQQELQTSIWNRLSEWFQGDFDNYAQVVEDRKQNLEPREGGGHEHFHCTLVPVTESTRLAAFFFDGNPDRIFRFRYYEMIPPAANDAPVEMMLNTLHPDLEKLLRSEASNPLSWPYIFENFKPTGEKEPKVNRLANCEISWSFQKDPIQHSYLTDAPEHDEDDDLSKSLHAVMVHGPTIVNSTIVPGMQIRIIDQLSLYQNTFYINDRGFDPITGSFIYGNQREVPYRLERVSSISSNSNSASTLPTSSKDGGLRRITTNSDLEWTLGPEFRSPEDYESKLELIGGPSVGINKKSFKKSDSK